MIRPEDNILDFVDDYVHGLLEPDDAQRVREYCETTRLGAVALEEAQRRREALQALPPSEAAESLIRRTVAGVEATASRRSRLRRYAGRTILLATAASVLIIGGFHLYYRQLQPSPYDLRLLGQQDLLADSNAALRVAVLRRDSGRPLAGVPVRVALYNPASGQEIQLASFTTDQQGSAMPRFELPDWEDGSYQLRVTATPDGVQEQITRSIELKREWRLMLSTDKPVYQPGQVIHVRSLGLKKPDLKPVAGHEVTFAIADPKGNVIFKQKDVTSRFGIASADCALAREILEGEYQLTCTMGETVSEATVTVERYVLPKFKVAVNLAEPFYAPGDEVVGQIQADYFFGKPVARADVQIEVRAADVGQTTIAALNEQTDAQGAAKFRFQLPNQLTGREQLDGNARLMVVATVTDSAGQKVSTGTSRVVTANPIGLEIIPESGSLVRDVPNTVYVFASYADGRPVQARLAVAGRTEELQTSRMGIAALEVTPRSDWVSLTIKATDAEGRVGRKEVQLQCGSYDGDFLIRTDRAVYTGGDTMRLEAMGGGVEPVFVDFLKDGQTILTRQIELQNGGGSYEFDLPPDVFGTLQICAYRFRAAGLAVRKSRVVYVQQARRLTVQVSADQPEYRPGQQASLTLTLTDPDGRPVPGAISLQAVDEAVYSVLSQHAGMERTFFLLEQEMLEPVYAIYPGWSPELFSELPGVERNRFEQALFSRTAAQAEGARALPETFFSGGQQVFHGDLEGQPSGWPFTLAATSFPDKVRHVTERQVAGLAAGFVAWCSLAAALVLIGIATFAVLHPKAFLIVAAACLLGSCLLSFPAMLFLVGARSPQAGMEMADAVGAPAPGAAEWGMDMEAPRAMPEMAMPESAVAEAGAAPTPRLRQWFPETLLWRPELITDDQGRVTLQVELADSITTWRLTTSAVSADGQLGGEQVPIKVFQPFFVDLDLPVSLTRNDQVGVPIVVYNYLDQPQTVRLTVKQSDWFQRLEAPNVQAESGEAGETVPEVSGQEADSEGNGDTDTDSDSDSNSDSDSEETRDREIVLELAAGEIRSLTVPIKVLTVGRHQLEVTALASGVSDAVRREIEVIADGRVVEQVASGTLARPLEMTLAVPEEAIPGSPRAILKLYPSTFSQLVEGLDAIFRMPSGCFEQTSSTTYPNVLALDYLRRTGKSVPEVEAKARQYIHTGYQRLVSFEVNGGGFDWFGRPPANRTLTAYGLMEFQDMARVHDVDPQLIQRTREWLLGQRRTDGSWPNESGMLDDGLAGSVNRSGNLDLAATAYIAWAVFADGQAADQAGPTLAFLLSQSPESIADPYLLAVTASAIAAINPSQPELKAYLSQLNSLCKHSDDGTHSWWQQATGQQTMFYGSGPAGDIETTAMAALALLHAGQHADTTRGALNWLIEQKDPHGTWHSTQATVLTLKALLAGTGAALGADQQRRIEVALGGETVQELVIPADQAEVMRQIDLSDMLVPGNDYALTVTDRSNTAIGYQVAVRYNVPVAPSSDVVDAQPLSVDIQYDRQRLQVDQTVTATATVTNNMQQAAPMVILDLPIPGGFVIEPGELDELVGSQQIARYQITPRKAIVYLRRLEAADSLRLRYRLRATMPVEVTVPDAEVYEYYDPASRGQGGGSRLQAVSA
jgi:uncharacterized protein YfaS (alpha-2-macroglobulin family)